MKKLLVKTIILCALIFVSVMLLVIAPLPENSYNLAIIDKNNLLANIRGKKAVLAGGSNLAFGVDSAKIEEAIDLPVINMGVHAGFGLSRILDDIALHLNAGDILVVAAEYSHFSNAWNGSDAAYELIFDTGFFKHHQRRLLLSRGYGLPSGFTAYLRTKATALFARFRKPNPRSYSRDGFNELGDYVNHLALESVPFKTAAPLTAIHQSYLALFFRVTESLRRQGVIVLITYPSYDAESFDASKDFIQQLDAAFRQKLTVISKPEDYRFDRKYFYDTTYHLNKQGRELRTARLAADIVSAGFLPAAAE
ncbi:MAG: hypothetical protein MdMp014T_1651 [Treponematales bacterium]